jgi:hypothetical protein
VKQNFFGVLRYLQIEIRLSILWAVKYLKFRWFEWSFTEILWKYWSTTPLLKKCHFISTENYVKIYILRSIHFEIMSILFDQRIIQCKYYIIYTYVLHKYIYYIKIFQYLGYVNDTENDTNWLFRFLSFLNNTNVFTRHLCIKTNTYMTVIKISNCISFIFSILFWAYFLYFNYYLFKRLTFKKYCSRCYLSLTIIITPFI